MQNKKLLANFIKSGGNASFAGKLSGISAGHARKLLKGMTVETAAAVYDSIKEEGFPNEILIPLSDIHYGEIIRPTILNGQNKYSCTIAKNRIKQIFCESTSLIDEKTSIIHIVNLGDPISGMLHEESMTEDEISPIRATNEMVKILRNEIEFLLKDHPHVKIIYYSVLDNHSRNTRRRRFKNAEDYSYNAQISKFLETFFERHERVEIRPCEEDILVEIDGTKWAFSHGDRGSGGSASGVVKGQAMSRLQAMENNWANVGQSPDYCMIGHFHTFAQVENWFICPAVCGHNEFITYGLRQKPKKPRMLLFRIQNGTIETQKNVPLV